MLISQAIRDGNYDANPILPKTDTPTPATFQITDTKLYVSVFIYQEKIRNFYNN